MPKKKTVNLTHGNEAIVPIINTSNEGTIVALKHDHKGQLGVDLNCLVSFKSHESEQTSAARM